MQLIDTHCHIHFDDYPLELDQVVLDAQSQQVTRLMCVGTTLADSQRAIKVAKNYKQIWASAGIHPHAATEFVADRSAQVDLFKLLNKSSISAIGEIGLDYYKNYSSSHDQKKSLRLQIEAGITTGLPFIFHVRDAWEDFFAILNSYPGLRGVVHSFSAHRAQLDQALERGLYIGLNGIMTFTKDAGQLAAAKALPLERLVLETDAPFLAPTPYRGQTCEPKHILNIAEFLSGLRGEPIEKLAAATTQNALQLFEAT